MSGKPESINETVVFDDTSQTRRQTGYKGGHLTVATSFELEGFEPIERIGGGGFGDVWLARQTNVDRKVAVKVGHAPIQDNIIRLRFERECKALGRLSGHPNIIDVYTAGTLADGRPYLALEYIDGGTLWERLRREPLSELDLCRLGEQISGALTVAHSAGVLHRDLKPENILMRSNGDAVLGDFGIARLQDGANTTSAAITASVAYAAPEVLGGTKASAASDLYGLGVCLLASILQSVPFVDKKDDSIHPIINRVMSEDHPTLRNRGLSEELTDLVDALLHKTPEQRPDSAERAHELFQDLHYRRRRDPGGSWDTAGRLQDQSGSATTGLRTQPAPAPTGGALGASPLTDPGPASQPGLSPATPFNRGSTFNQPAAPSPGMNAPTWDRPKSLSSSPGRTISTGSSSQSNGLAQTGTGIFDHISPKVRAFAAAYALTLVVGLLLIFLLAQIL